MLSRVDGLLCRRRAFLLFIRLHHPQSMRQVTNIFVPDARGRLSSIRRCGWQVAPVHLGFLMRAETVDRSGSVKGYRSYHLTDGKRGNHRRTLVCNPVATYRQKKAGVAFVNAVRLAKIPVPESRLLGSRADSQDQGSSRRADRLSCCGRQAGAQIDRRADEASEADTADIFTACSRSLGKLLWVLEAHTQEPK